MPLQVLTPKILGITLDISFNFSNLDNTIFKLYVESGNFSPLPLCQPVP